MAFACVATAALVARIAGDTLFLEEFGAELLPYLYIASSVLVAAVASLVGAMARRVPVRRLGILSALALALFALLIRLAVPALPTPAHIAAGLFADLVINLPAALFWSLAGVLFNPREAKRGLGLIGATGTLGCICAGLWVRPFARSFGAENLLLVVAVLLAGFALAVAFIVGAEPAGAAARPTEGAGRMGSPLGGSPQVLAVALLVVASATAMTLADFQFKAAASRSFEPAELAGFFGRFYAAANAAALAVQLLFVHRILAVGGLLAGLLVLPATLALVAPMLLASGTLFWICAARAAFAVFGVTIDSAAVQLASLAIKKQTRPRAKAAIDAVYKPVAVALTATTIIALHPSAPRWVVPAALLVVCLAWVGAAIFARKAYIEGLLASIERETLDFSEQELASAFGRDLQSSLADRLSTAADAEVPYLIGLIGEQRGASYAAAARPLLARDSPEVRRVVLEYLAREGEAADVGAILPMLGDADDGVRRAALEAVAALGGERAVGALKGRLVDPDAGIRARAAALLAELGDLEEILAGSSVLKAMLGSREPETRGMAVAALGRMRRGSVWKVIRNLMRDSDPAVRRAAIEASRTHPEPEILEALLAALDDSVVSDAAEDALVGFGAQLVEMVGAWPAGRNNLPIRVPALLARAGTSEALPLLLDLADGEHRGLHEEAVLAIIALCRGRAPEPGLLERLGRLARAEAEAAQQFRRRLVMVQGLAGSEALEFALREEMLLHFRNLVHLASSIVPGFEPGPICQAAENGDTDARAAAAEVVDNVLPGDLRRLLVPLLERDPERPAGADPMAEVVSILVSPPSEWVLSAALFFTARTGRTELAPLVARECGHPNPIVRETALFALRDLGDGERLAEAARRLIADPEPVVRTLARSLLPAPGPGGPR